jgi:membrane-bound lytic murein transglycosylase D
VPDVGGEGVHYVTEEDAQSGSIRQVSAVPGADDFHIVRRGENLSSIAHRYGVTIDDLKKLNNLSSRSLIRKGQKLRVRPEAGPRSADKKSGPAALAQFKSRSTASHAKSLQAEIGGRKLAGQSRKHTVRRGETLYDVSKRYGIGLTRLARANNVRVNYRVMAGEKLIIPE